MHDDAGKALDHTHSSIAPHKLGWRGLALNAILRRVVKWRLQGIEADEQALAQMTHLVEQSVSLKRYTNISITRQSVNGVETEILEPATNRVDVGRVDACRVDTSQIDHRRVLYLHGGAFVMCSPTTHRSITTALVRHTAATVWAPAYRLAPRYSYPAQLEDCLKVYRAMLESTAARHIALAGDSAGGNLVLTMLHAAQAEGLPMPACTVCLSPWTDLAGRGQSLRDNVRKDVMLPAERMAELVRLYLDGAHPKDPLASPLYGNFNGFPPLLFHVGDSEILLDDTLRTVQKARAAGIEAHLRVWSGFPHVFHAFADYFSPAGEALKEVADFINAKLVS